jgi:carbon monoxide dehydrogenase subunit G
VPILTERITTRLPIEEAFAFVGDFANAERWDPGVASSKRVPGATADGGVSVGTSYDLGVRVGGRVAPMTYVVTRYEPGRRVVLKGSGAGVEAIDDIGFAPSPDGGTAITYVADIRLVGWRRILAPFAGPAFRRLAANAKAGMERALEQVATARSRNVGA